ncbi:nitrate- and nitrite sensing domain-containing protein [Streptomyces sp. NPDC090108]|uniref:sensor histidine kinase n=1 Tax=Streptomyces sp. NPDC090108 TaxID=3365947 RepID=UPI0037F1E78B
MRVRSWSIRNKLVALLVLPLMSLAVLWAYAAYLSLGNAMTLAHENTLGNRLAIPMIEVFNAVGHERRDSVVVTSGKSGGRAALDADRQQTEAALKSYLAQSDDNDVRDAENSLVRHAVDRAGRSMSGLDRIRHGVDEGTLSSGRTMAAYNEVTNAIERALHSMVILPDQNAQAYGEALYNLAPVGDLRSQEDGLISAAAASPSRRMTPDAYAALVQDIGSQRYLMGQALEDLPAAQRSQFEKLGAPGGPVGRLTALEEQAVAAGAKAKPLPFPAATWRAVYDAEDKAVSATSVDDISALFKRTGPPAHRAFVELIVSGVLGLVALVASVVISTSIARSLVNDVMKLRSSARNLTDDRLRDVVGRLRRGESVDVRGDMTEPHFVNHEMAQLGDAFQALQLTALELAEEDIRLHRGISDVFLNLARRSQVLVHRQLALIDTMEAREENPKVLADLFLLDQLATRMRRYAEGLIIVSGAPPGRFWRHPVPVVDVIRGAVSETEQYARVVVMPVPTVGVLGRAAADVIHLLAELVENAEAFSPDDSQVRVSISKASGGLVIEIDDRGLGMQEEDMALANARITAEFDVSSLDSTRLGLVTVGRLAQRHGVNVSLRNSPYGGVSAVVLIPHTLLEWDANALPGPSAATAGRLHLWDGGAVRGELSDVNGTSVPVHRPGQSSGPMSPYAAEAEQVPEPGHVYETVPLADHSAYPVPPADHSAYRAPADHSMYPAPPAAHGPYPRSPVPPTAHIPYPPSPERAAVGQPEPSEADYDEQDTVDGLPRRVPQASLARELREEPEGVRRRPAMDWGAGPAAPAGPGRTPGAAAGPGGAERFEQRPRGGASYAVPGQGYPPAARGRHAGERGAGPVSLFGNGAPAPPAAAAAGTDHEGRPEHVRTLMSALQAGAARARADQSGNGHA